MSKCVCGGTTTFASSSSSTCERSVLRRPVNAAVAQSYAKTSVCERRGLVASVRCTHSYALAHHVSAAHKSSPQASRAEEFSRRCALVCVCVSVCKKRAYGLYGRFISINRRSSRVRRRRIAQASNVVETLNDPATAQTQAAIERELFISHDDDGDDRAYEYLSCVFFSASRSDEQ